MRPLVAPPFYRSPAIAEPSTGAAPAPLRAQGALPAPAVEFDRVCFAWDDHIVLDEVSFRVEHGTMRVLLGASGTGKTTILKLILGLLRPDAGRILVDGERTDNLGEPELLRIRRGIGMLFQENALFDSLTVGENVGYRLDDEGRMPPDEVDRRVTEVVGFVGLSDFVDRLPSELSGGQRRRVGLARAMAARPGLLLLDDPTTGLDPILATTVDDEIVKLRDLEHITSIFVTHQIRDAFYIAEHRAVRTGSRVEILPARAAEASAAEFMVLHDGVIVFEGGAADLLSAKDDYLRRYLLNTLPPW